MPHDLINAKPVTAVIKEFFGSSASSRSSWTRPTRSRRSRTSGASRPSGPAASPASAPASRCATCTRPTTAASAPSRRRKVRTSASSRRLSTYARVNEFGFVETPYRKVEDGERHRRGGVLLGARGGEAHHRPGERRGRQEGQVHRASSSPARRGGEFVQARAEDVDLMDVSPNQLVSVAASLIPFLENDDANRALMGSNMQRQAVPLLRTAAPLVGTGIEAHRGPRLRRHRAWPSATAWSRRSTPTRIVVKADVPAAFADVASEVDIYNLIKYQRSNQNTCLNQKPIVKQGRPGEEGRRHRRRPGHRDRRAGAGPERGRRVHAVAGLQLRGLDPPLRERWSRTTSSPRSTSRSSSASPATPSWARKRSPATSRTSARRPSRTSTSRASSASAPR